MPAKKPKRVITKVGLLIAVVLGTVLLWGLSRSVFEPESLMGRLNSSLGGRILFGLMVTVPILVVGGFLEKKGYPVTRLKLPEDD